MNCKTSEKSWSEFKSLIEQIDEIKPSASWLVKVVQSDGFDQMKNILLAEIEDQDHHSKD